MSVFKAILELFGGLALFLYGMNVMSNSLEKRSGSKMAKGLRKVTSNPVSSLLLGAGITVAVQSSSAVTVMLVGLVNSGVMELSQTVGIIFGSNIGTTLTAWILSLLGVDGDSNFFVAILNPRYFTPLVALIGVVMTMACKKQKKKDIGVILIGFAVLMYGMIMMSDSMAPLTEEPAFMNFINMLKEPGFVVIIGALIGSTLFTGVIQSSAAAIGMLQALVMAENVEIYFFVALPLVLGQNIGTCMTAILSCFGVGKEGKRVAAVHLSIKIIGALIVLFGYFALDAVFHFGLTNLKMGVVSLALLHTAFNLLNTVLLMPFSKQLVKLAERIVPDKEAKNEEIFLDERLLNTPTVAIQQCRSMTVDMAVAARDNLFSAMGMLIQYDPSTVDELNAVEEQVDLREDRLGTYLVKVSAKELSGRDSREVSRLLHSIGDFERIGDHAINVLGVATELFDKESEFTAEGKADIAVLSEAIREIVGLAVDAFIKNDTEIAKRIEPLEQVIDDLIDEAKLRHVRRLQAGKCTLKLGFVLSDLLTDFERISDHCSNIAACLVQLEAHALDTHEYLHQVKSEENESFMAEYNAFAKKYSFATT